MNSQMKIITDLLWSRNLICWLNLAIISLIAGAIFHIPAYLIVGSCLLYVLFDLIGYENLGDYLNYKRLGAYRIVQHIFLGFITLTLFHFGWKVGLSFLILHFTGVNDVLYYIIGRYRITDIWTWYDWTIWGLFKRKDENGNKVFYKWQVLLQAELGLIAVILWGIL